MSEAYWISAMPDELATAVERLDGSYRRAANTGWLRVGVEGRQQCTDFVLAGFGWTRRLRCQIVLRRLIRAGEPRL